MVFHGDLMDCSEVSAVTVASSLSHKLDGACPESTPTPSKQRQLLVVAAPRSGTHYAVDVLRRLGVEVNHEGVNEVNLKLLFFRRL